MTIRHRVDSILGIKKKREAENKLVSALGQQVTMLTIENSQKDQTVEAMGKQFTATMLQLGMLQKEVNDLKKGDKDGISTDSMGA